MERYDAATVRGLYAGLSDGWTYLNAHAAPQVAETVSRGVARAFRCAHAVFPPEETGGSHSAAPVPGELEAHRHISGARIAVADLVGTRADAVVLGPSLPVLYAKLARSLHPLLRHRSTVVLSLLDDPAITAAIQAGLGDAAASVRWAQPDLGTGELPDFQFRELVDGSTRLVALSAAHDLLGTVAPVEEIVEVVRAQSRAWSVVDVSALAPYRPLDMMGADIVAVDLGKLGGPELAALAFRDTAMFKRISSGAAKLDSAVSPGLAGGAGPLVDHLASLAGGEAGSRRKRLAQSMALLQDYLDDLRDDLYIYLSTLQQVHVLGYSGEAAAGASKDRIPRLTFAVKGVPAETVHRRLFDNGLVTTVAPDTPLLRDMGLAEIGGGVTVSLSPFSTRADIEHLTRVVASLA